MVRKKPGPEKKDEWEPDRPIISNKASKLIDYAVQDKGRRARSEIEISRVRAAMWAREEMIGAARVVEIMKPEFFSLII